ncbi:MAG: very short patch repair endonuclease [Candidatus Sumerlaeia bacterium]
MDTVSRAKRSSIMASVKGRGNKSTEAAIVLIFRKMHVVGWRRHYPIVGKPDFVFRKERIALFVDGCFWHGCPDHCRIPQSNRDYWLNKIVVNKKRDTKIRRKLRSNGWSVIRVWEHEIKTKAVLKKIQKIKKMIMVNHN